MTTEHPAPLYIVSKGRSRWCHTMRALDAMHVPYRVVVEPSEADAYAARLRDPACLLVLPSDPVGQGSIPARNFAYTHAVESGAPTHWCLDDNLKGFHVLTDNKRLPAKTGGIFRAAEDFVARYTNIGLAGFQYSGFANRRAHHVPFTLNTRIYSCVYLVHDVLATIGEIPPWRGLYNEDTDLSLRVLKSGACTVLFYAFLAHKRATGTIPGGNTDSLYRAEKARLAFARELQSKHPDLVRVGTRFGRDHHWVDYTGFGQRLAPRPGVVIPRESPYTWMRITLEADAPRAYDYAPRAPAQAPI